MPTAPLKLTDEIIKRTTSRCPVCHAPCPAEVWRTGGIQSKIFLKRTCAEHGEVSVCIASDARFYWLAKGKAENACCFKTGAGWSAGGSNSRTLGRKPKPR